LRQAMAEKTDKTGPSKAERGRQMRTRLLEATIQSIAHDGISGASIERITERAGVSRGLVRHYYGNKSQLLVEAFQLLADDFRDMLGMGDAAVLSGDARSRLRRAILPMFERISGGREHQYAWFGFWALARSESEIQRMNHELYEDVTTHLGNMLAAAAVEQGRKIDAAAAGRGLAAMAEGAWVHCVIGVEGVTIAGAERLCLEYAAELVGLPSLDDPAAP
jgi:TetR/AcrR family transcriptional regulator, transcriptional repressor of bet genes